MTTRRETGRRPWTALAAGVIAAMALCAAAATATTLLKLDVEKMSREASMIVIGHVAWSYSAQPASDGPIYTYNGVEVSRCVAGDCPETVTLKHRGGTIGKLTLYIPGMPKLVVGEKVLLFLRDDPEGQKDMYAVFGMCQGHFRILSDPETGTQQAVQQLGAVTLAAPGPSGKIAPVPAVAPVQMEIEQLVARIVQARSKASQEGAQ